jgi:hypothetical protein
MVVHTYNPSSWEVEAGGLQTGGLGKMMSQKSSKQTNKTKNPTRQALVSHIYNPRYSGGRDQEDHGLKPA